MWWLLVLLLTVLLLLVLRNHALGVVRFKERPAVFRPERRCWTLARRIFFGLNTYRSRITKTPSDFGWDYTVCSLVPESGVVLSCWHIPQCKSSGMVLLVNWLGGCKSDNLAAAGVFLELGYEVFLVDLRGHGDSSGMDTTFGYYEYRDVLTAVEYVQSLLKPEKLVIYGVSLGAAAAMRAFYAGVMRNVDRLIIEAPFDRLIKTIRHRVGALGLPEGFFSEILGAMIGLIQKFNPWGVNPLIYAGYIEIPVLIMQRRFDPFIREDEVRAVFNNLKDIGNSELLLVEAGGHGSIVTSHRELFKEEVGKFLEAV